MSFEVLACRRQFHPGKLKQQFLRFYCIGFLVYCTWTYLIWRPRCMLQNSPSHFWQVSSCYYIHTSSCIICAIRGKLLRERDREGEGDCDKDFGSLKRLLAYWCSKLKKKKGFIKRQLILKNHFNTGGNTQMFVYSHVYIYKYGSCRGPYSITF